MSGHNRTIFMAAATVWCASIVMYGESVATYRRPGGLRLPGALDVSQPAQELPSGEGAEITRNRCTTCHGSGLIVQQRLSRDGWSREIDKMVGWGAVIPEVERNVLLNYLAAIGGAAPEAAQASAAVDGAALLKTRCLVCHDLHLVDQQRLDAAGWRREMDKMIGWGATLTDAEKDALIEHLARRRS